MSLELILKDSNYKLTQFKIEHIKELENTIFEKEVRDKKSFYIKCLVRNKDIKLTPEEVVRQLFLLKLHKDYGYPYNRMQIEFAVHFGREVKRADIVIMDKVQPTVPYIVIEVKKPKLKDGKEQLKSYCNSTGATIAIWSNGEQTTFYHRKDPNYFEPIPDIPSANKSLKDVLKEEFTIQDLIQKDILKTQKRSLKNIVLDMEDEVLANAGVDVFEEVFKLIFIKLFDELQNTRGLTKNLEFRNYGESDGELKEKIDDIFNEAKEQWSGIFKEDEIIELSPSHLSVCVSSLQDVKLFNSNLDVIDDAFEYLVNKNAKGEKGQYFTPRYVIDMCVRMMNPQEDEYMIDSASGSCGFPIHTVFDVWKKIYADLGIEESHLFTAEEKHPRALKYVKEKVFGIDFDKKTVRVARMLNIIAGDGHTNVLNMNSLDFERWDENLKDEDWTDTYFEGWKRLKKLRKVKNENKEFNFDIVMANPPFAGDIKEGRILHRYELGKKPNGKYQTKVGRDILFIERNLDMLKSGGRMAVVLPQGRFNNSSDKNIRDFIAEKCRILAVVGLHGNVFKPHTGTKTSVLIVQKWDDKLCPKKDDYNIFFATMQEPSKDNSGEKIYVKNEDGTNRLDNHDHLIVKHDLFNHDEITQNGIAEAFNEFAKKEKLSFVGKSESPFNEVKYNALLSGLEAVELKLSEVLEDNFTFRFDPEYFKRIYLKIEQNIKNKKFDKLINLSNKITDFGAFSQNNFIEYKKKGNHYFIRNQDMKDMFISDEKIFIDENVYNKLTLKLDEYDLLLQRTGSIGKAGMVLKKDLPSSANQNLAQIKLNLEKINPYYINTFLNSKIGNNIFDRLATGNVQPWLNLGQIENIKIPIFLKDFQAKVETIVKSSYQKLENSKTLYKQAEELLLKELDLLNFTPSKEKVAIKSFSESFGVSGRLDSEYYQPKYDEIIEKIKSYNCGYETINEACTLKNVNYKLEDKKFYQYIELSNIGTTGDITGCTYEQGKDLPSRARRLIKENDVIISSIEGSLEKVAIVRKEFDNSLCSTGFYVINSDKVNTETLLVLFKNRVIQQILKKNCSGTILTAINKDEFLNIVIPIIDINIQTKIEEKIKESFKLKEESKQLLEVAKRAVEIAIEDGEDKAMEYIKRKVKK